MNPVIGVNPALLGSSAAVEAAGAGVMGGAASGAAPVVCAVLPPGGDAGSIAAAGGLNARGAATMAVMTNLTTVRTMFANTVGVSGVSYAATDAIAQATLAI